MRYYEPMTTPRGSFRDALTRRILVLDGAMGTMIQAADLDAADFGGAALEGCNEHLNLTRPDVIRGIHAAYLEAGADLISTNTFGCAPYVLAEYGLAERAYEITRAAARLAREAVPAGRFVIGAMGPSTRSISVTRNVTFDEVLRAYEVQAAALVAGGVDALLLETTQDTLNVKAAAIGVGRAMREAGVEIGGVDSGDDVGPREVQVLVAAVERGAAEIGRAEAGGLDHRAHRAVQDEDPARERIAERGPTLGHRFIVAHAAV